MGLLWVIEALVIVGVVGTIKKVGGCAGEGTATAKPRRAKTKAKAKSKSKKEISETKITKKHPEKYRFP